MSAATRIWLDFPTFNPPSTPWYHFPPGPQDFGEPSPANRPHGRIRFETEIQPTSPKTQRVTSLVDVNPGGVVPLR